jgi:hypothetical protein
MAAIKNQTAHAGMDVGREVQLQYWWECKLV